MTQWTDKHYDLNYKLTEQDIKNGSIRVDAYFVAKQWKTGSKDDSGALFHLLKTIARFGDKNEVEREIKALYAQVLGVARGFGVELLDKEAAPSLAADHRATDGLWYPDDSMRWVEHTTSQAPFGPIERVEVLTQSERDAEDYSRQVLGVWDVDWTWDLDSGKIVAYKVVE